MRVHLVLVGLLGYLASLSLWIRARKQPEDVPMYSLYGHRRLSRKDVYVGAIVFPVLGTLFVMTGLALG
jgi:hypothetical protein